MGVNAVGGTGRRCMRSDRTNHSSAVSSRAARGGCHDRQRQRAAACRGRAGQTGGCAIYLHQSNSDRPVRASARGGCHEGVVRCQLLETLQAHGLHERTDAGSTLACTGANSTSMRAPQRLILASASLGRRALLAQAGYQFDVKPSGVDEPPFVGFPGPRTYVQYVAWLKAAAVAATVPNGIVVAADSVAWQGNDVIGKPVDAADARRILGRLAGTTHELWTGVCLWRRPGDWQVCWQEASVVEMRRWTADELDAYLASGV